MSGNKTYLREILFEFHPTSGRAVRVVAIDPVTGTEVVMVGDSRVGDETLKRTAARKLDYVLNKNKEKSRT